ncbi:hypothetical protein N7G274_003760 [Stereocaulon virgatum]|uniref:Uncharacterized protein n=1 Tax=Stereocaulon virgatum TaxID=373712 RepID=A0ABR4ACE6_9LECA
MPSLFVIAVLLQLHTLILAAAPQPSPFLSLTNVPTTSEYPSPANRLPPHRLTYRIQRTTTSITFYGYTRTIDQNNAAVCVQRAKEECISKIDDWNQPIAPSGVAVKSWRSGLVILKLYPQANMLWREWTNAVVGLEWFLEQYEAVDVVFTVSVEGKGLTVASGKFITWARNSTSAADVA